MSEKENTRSRACQGRGAGLRTRAPGRRKVLRTILLTGGVLGAGLSTTCRWSMRVPTACARPAHSTKGLPLVLHRAASACRCAWSTRSSSPT